MNIVRGVEQGSEEWLALRAGRVTASNFGKVLARGKGATRTTYMRQLLAERLSGEPQPTFTNEAMQWGTETEPRARAVYELLTGQDVEQVTMVEHDADIACSPDGLLPASGLEIKCPQTATHIGYVLDAVCPAAYVPQVQGCIWICEVDRWEFMSFDPRLPQQSQSVIVSVDRDDHYISNLESEVRRFVEEMKELEHRLRGDQIPGFDDLETAA